MNKRKTWKRVFAVLLTVVMYCSMSVSAFAAETSSDGNIWHGDKLAVEVKEGTNGYMFQSVYVSPHRAYEMSNHMVSANGGVNKEIPQLLVMVDASEDYTWTPDGEYSYGESNYEAMYCCDAETGYSNGVHYKRINLEDSNYYTEEEAAHIRAIVSNAYPFVSMKEMKANLKADGFAGADELTRAEIITAVQAAIWAYANDEVGDYTYAATFHVPDNSQWGGVIHDYTHEMQPIWWKTGKRQLSEDETVANRINTLIEYLKGLEPMAATKDQVIISDIQVLNTAPALDEKGLYNIDLQVRLNNSGSSEKDNIALYVYVEDQLVKTEPIKLGTEEYAFTVEAKLGQTIKAVVSGTQDIPMGVYFYEPEGGRDVSQCLVGVASGETDVYAEASVIVLERILQFNKTTTTDLGKKPLEGIIFDIYYAGTVDEYTQFVENFVANNKELADLSGKEIAQKAQNAFEAAKAAEVKNGTLACVETVTTDITGKAIYNITKDQQPDGVYLVIEREHPAIATPLDPFVVAVPMTSEDGSGLIYDVLIEPKNELNIPEIHKDVMEIGNDMASVDAYAPHTWIISTNVPKDIAGGKLFSIKDTLDNRLDYVGNVKVQVEYTKEVTGEEAETIAPIELVKDTDYILTVLDNDSLAEAKMADSFTIKLTQAGMEKVGNAVGAQCDDYMIRVYFDAKINANAAMGDMIPNQATLIYTNSVNFEFEVESDEPVVYTCGINVFKKDAKTESPLAGAMFKVARLATEEEIAAGDAAALVTAEGAVQVVYVDFFDNRELTGEKVSYATSDESGSVYIYGLQEMYEMKEVAGQKELVKTTLPYYLVEIKAPAGYNLLSYPVEMELHAGSHTTENLEEGEIYYAIEVANSNAFVLPTTGGIGTAIFTLAGSLMMAGAGVILVSKKREED